MSNDILKNGNIIYLEEKDCSKPWVFIYKESELDGVICSYACICLEQLRSKTNNLYCNPFSSVLGNKEQFNNIREATADEVEKLFAELHHNGYDFDFSLFTTIEFKYPQTGDIIVRKDDKDDYCIIIYINDDKFYITKPNANCFLKDGSPGLYINHTTIRDFYIDNEYFIKKFEPSEPFEKVLVRNDWEEWTIDFFAYKTDANVPEYLAKPYKCMNGKWKYCVLYNDKTKHLLGTQEFLKL